MWRAKFDDGKIFEEFNAQGKEILFGKVLKYPNPLESLSIILENKIFTIRMADGRFSVDINGNVTHFFASDIDITLLSNIRPIYFVREIAQLSMYSNNLSTLSPTINFIALGFQANYKGANIKKYLAIFPDGTFIIRGE